MNPLLRNILAVVIGLFIGGMINMALITISSKVIAPPAGADLTTYEGLVAAMPLMEPKHFLMPFLAHALGTFSAALIAGLIGTGNKIRLGIIIGIVFMAGGVAAILQLPAPMWFNITDLVFAYLPMGWLGARLTARKK